jgi:hypothetical protein
LALVAMVLALAPSAARGQITVTQPGSGATVVNSAVDWATRTFQDPMDMSQRTDLGWWQYAVDQPVPNLSGLTFAGGALWGTATTNQPRFVLLETGIPPAYAAPLGRNGNVSPINATYYRTVAFRLRLTQAASGAFEYYSGDIYRTAGSNSNPFPAYGPLADSSVPGSDGWHVYVIDMPTLGVQSWSAGGVWGSSSTIGTLHLNATDVAGTGLGLDWVRIVNKDPGLYRTIQWTGGGSVDIFLDNDRTYANGTWGTIARSLSGSTYSFYVGAMPPGDYYVGIRPAGSTATPVYSAGYYRVTSTPTLVFAAPGEEGSGDDYAANVLGNPWDMNAVSDLDYAVNIDGLGLAGVTAETEAGVPLGSVPMLTGVSYAATPQSVVGDPYVYLLAAGVRGNGRPVDTDRYRILTLELGISGRNRDLAHGSVARIVWRRSDETVYNVSQDILLNHLPDRNVLQKLTLDLKQLPLETDPGGSLSQSGWTGSVVELRVDPHEFSDPTQLYVKRARLAALDRADTSFTVRWHYADSGPSANSPLVSLYYDMDQSSANGRSGTIALNLDAQDGQYIWNTAALPHGASYYVCADYSNGSQSNTNCSKWPVLINHAVGSGAGNPAAGVRLGFDGHGATDVSVYRPSTGEWFVLPSANGFTGGYRVTFGAAGDQPVWGDFDGDGRRDHAVYRPSSGTWFWLTSSSGNTLYEQRGWGVLAQGDVPAPGDFDGDGRTDPTVFRPGTGSWFVLQSSSNYTRLLSLGWGASGDEPVPGDYDGDGRTDAAVYRRSTGQWFILPSSSGFTTGWAPLTFGAAGDVPLRGDFDGDGKRDIAVYRPSAGTWFILRSSSGNTAYDTVGWGLQSQGDVPVPGDYDGDGRTDPCVFRPQTGSWFALKSSSGYAQAAMYGWGLAGDTPLGGQR